MEIVLWELCRYINETSPHHSSQFRFGVGIIIIVGCHIVNFHCTSKSPWQKLHFFKYAEILGPALSFKLGCSNSTEHVASSSSAVTAPTENVLCEGEDGLGSEGGRLDCGLHRRVNNLRAGVASCAHVQHHTCRGEEIKDGRRGLIIRKMCSSAMLTSKDKA